MGRELTDERPIFLSTLPAGSRERGLALIVVAVSATIFVAAVPFAKVQLAPVAAFIPIYQSALILNDLITAVLLFGQSSFLKSRALLVLASGYLFSAAMAVAHALTFPGLFAPTGLLNAGPQSTGWLYFIWHAGFPLFIIAYARLTRGALEAGQQHVRARIGIPFSIAATLTVAIALTLVATAGHEILPTIMYGNRVAPAQVIVSTTTWLLSLIALAILWSRRPHSVLDLWLMVVLCAWLFDSALASVLNTGRYDVGWYAGRVYGLLASSFVLMVLLVENSVLYGRLVEAHGTHARRLKILHEIDRAVAAEETPAEIAGAAIEPLREVLGASRAVVNIFDLAAGEVEWLAAAGRRRTRVGPGVRYSIRLMGDVEALKRGEPQVIDTHALPPGPEMDALLASGVHVYMVVPMIAGGDLMGAISFGGEAGPFPDEQKNIAQEVATQLAIAVNQARLYERVKHHAEELELRVRERTAELLDANKELDAFSYSVSHDLRAPLRAIDGYARMLEEDYGKALDVEGVRLLGVVRANSRRMGQLIDELLAFSRLGREPLRTRPVQLDELVTQIIDETRADHNGRIIDFVIGTLGIAEADPALLKQALVNLLSNAIKFTRDNHTAIIEIGCTSKTDLGEATTYYVKDNGAGFDMKYYDKLFGVFQRLHSNTEYPGTGVGLAIVQRVIHRHGGRVWADARPGEGATFYFTLQQHPQETATAGASPVAASDE
jgi:signal transduction histidine kinase